MMKMAMTLVSTLVLLTSANAATIKTDTNPFANNPNVIIFTPPTTPQAIKAINDKINSIYATQELGQFNTQRYALLFEPGTYGDANNPVDVKVGYYTQVLGLGETPDDVKITGAVRTQDDPATEPVDHGPGALNNFWRSAENLEVTPTLGSMNAHGSAIPKDQDVWAVSQAAPLRRMHINGTLRLFDIGWSSGGFMADSKIDNDVITGSQQQWFTRNSQWNGNWQQGNWNMVFVGNATPTPISQPTVTPPPGTWQDWPYTTVDKTPIIREKPFLIEKSGQWFVKVPDLQTDTNSVDWTSGKELPISDFYIANPKKDTATTINDQLAAGKNLIFSPGIYNLDSSILVKNKDTVVLGIGMPSLHVTGSQPAIDIADVPGVLLGGVLVDAGPNSGNTTLVQVGDGKANLKDSSDPTILYDLFCRVGGEFPGKAGSCVTINSNDVIGDNLWLWRADHGDDVSWTQNTADNGIIVNGNDVTIYGLAVEHFQKNQTVWNGDNGKTYFYQSEMPYDPPNQAAWMNGKLNGYASYKVGDSVTQHQAWGVGIYSYFKDSSTPIYADNAIVAPKVAGIKFTDMLDVYLNGGAIDNGIKNIIDGQGGDTIATGETNKMAGLSSNA